MTSFSVVSSGACVVTSAVVISSVDCDVSIGSVVISVVVVGTMLSV